MKPTEITAIIDNMLDCMDGTDGEKLNEIFNGLTPSDQSRALFFGVLDVLRLHMRINSDSEAVSK